MVGPDVPRAPDPGAGENVGEGVGEDAGEDLVQPRGRSLTNGIRVRLELLGAVAVLALVAVAVGARSGHGSGPPVTPSTAVVTSPPPTAPDTPVVLTPVPQIEGLPDCPDAGDGEPSCTAVESVPPRFVAAVRELLPGVRTSAAVSEKLRAAAPGDIPGLWSRLFTGHTGATRIRIVVCRGTGSIPVTRDPADGLGVRVVVGRHRTSTYVVEVQVTTTSSRQPSQHDVDELAADARLLVPS
jgi:hypothetical protein